MPTVDDGLRRCREYCLPLENQRVQRAQNTESYIGKHVSIDREDVDGRITLVLIKEPLGY